MSGGGAAAPRAEDKTASQPSLGSLAKLFSGSLAK